MPPEEREEKKERQLSTGLVIAGAYADKLRRTLFAQLRDYLRQGKIDSQEVVRAAGEVNRLLFDILVNKLKLDKGDVVRIRINYVLEDTPDGKAKIKWLYDTLTIEAFRRIPQEEVDKAVKETIGRKEEVLEAPVTRAEAEWTGEKPSVHRVSEYVQVADIALFSKVRGTDEYLYMMNDKDGNHVGILIAKPADGGCEARAIFVLRGMALEARLKLDKPADKLEEAKEEVIKALSEAEATSISKEEAQRLITDYMQRLE